MDGSTDAASRHAPDGVPNHVAIIMDGNGRWAEARGLPRVEGHRRGLDALRRTIIAADGLGVRFLTVYSFSSENWRRPTGEVTALLALLRRFVRADTAELHANNVRIRFIGMREGLADDIRALFAESEALTAGNTGLTLVVAFNYGSRDEILRAAKGLVVDAAAGRLAPEAVDEALFASRLDTADVPDPDLVIRTSGEMRLSNFLLWQTAYSEFVFTPVCWPDFDGRHFEEALDEFRRRNRRFGGLSASGGRS